MTRPGFAILNTQPGAAGERLSAELRARGRSVHWLPAFAFGPAPQPQQVAEALRRLDAYDLAIFVSPQAVRAAFAVLPDRASWPAGLRLAAVGSGTAAALIGALGDGARRVIAPTPAATADDGAAAAGSEALWPLLRTLQPSPRNVLLLRAQQGREWLSQRLGEQGAQVTPLAVYARTPLRVDAAARAALADCPLASVFSSSEAVEVIVAQLADTALLARLRQGPAFAIHPRIADALRAHAFACVRHTAARADAIDAALVEIEQIESPGS